MMMYKQIVFLLLITFSAQAQENSDISKWKVAFSKTGVRPGDEIDVIFSADINKEWKLYSSDFKGDIGPLPTTFQFTRNDGYRLVGDIKPVSPSKTVDPTWDVAYTYFLEKAEFRQRIKIVKKDALLKGTIKGLLCNNKDGVCVPFQETFQVN